MQRRFKSSTTAVPPQSLALRLQKMTELRPKLAFVLGSGFHAVGEHVLVDLEIPYGDLPGFPVPSVKGHVGKLLIGRIGHEPVLLLSGRAHFYEGGDLRQTTFPIRVLHALGVKDLVLTNAAGGINRTFRPGDFMLVKDHINLMGANPLHGPVQDGLSRFVDMTRAYDSGLTRLLRQAGRKAGATMRSGIYLAVAGPNYETPAEIRAFARLGADAVGMSTVPEVLVARQCGIRVAALSCITNLAAGLSPGELSHEEVLANASSITKLGGALLLNFAQLYGREL